MNKNKKHTFSLQQTDRIIEMAWEDRTPFEAIEQQFGINQDDVIKIMRKNLKRKSFQNWRERTKGRKSPLGTILITLVCRFGMVVTSEENTPD